MDLCTKLPLSFVIILPIYHQNHHLPLPEPVHYLLWVVSWIQPILCSWPLDDLHGPNNGKKQSFPWGSRVCCEKVTDISSPCSLLLHSKYQRFSLMDTSFKPNHANPFVFCVVTMFFLLHVLIFHNTFTFMPATLTTAIAMIWLWLGDFRL